MKETTLNTNTEKSVVEKVAGSLGKLAIAINLRKNKRGLSPARTRVIIAEMDDVEAIGGNSNKTYRLK